MSAFVETNETAAEVIIRQGTPSDIIARIRKEYGLMDVVRIPLIRIFRAASRCYHNAIDDVRADTDYATYEIMEILPYYMIRFGDPDVYGDTHMVDRFRVYCFKF